MELDSDFSPSYRGFSPSKDQRGLHSTTKLTCVYPKREPRGESQRGNEVKQHELGIEGNEARSSTRVYTYRISPATQEIHIPRDEDVTLRRRVKRYVMKV